MIARKAKFVVAFACALVLATIFRGVAASLSSTIYSFGTTTPIDGGAPKGSLTNVNGVLFGRTTTTTVATPTPTPMPGATPTSIGSYGVIFHVDPAHVASSYSIDHVFADNSDDGADPRHDAMTPFKNLLYGYHIDRWSEQFRDHLFDRPGWHWLPGANELC
jgi:hypothetical protein